MDLKKLLEESGLQDHPAGLAGCRARGHQFDSCDYDVIVFDGERRDTETVLYRGEHARIHHHSLDDSGTGFLIHLDGMRVVSDDSWEVGSKLLWFKEHRARIFRDHARSCLVEAIICCEKCSAGQRSGDPFSACWQRCASYLLADAISALNMVVPSPSHMLEQARTFKESAANAKLSAVTDALGAERATPSLLERMSKSTVGFLEAAGDSNAGTVRRKHEYLVGRSMLSDCYFYLGQTNKAGFLRIQDSLPRRPDLIHMLRIAFDLEADPARACRHAGEIRGACLEILDSMRKVGFMPIY